MFSRESTLMVILLQGVAPMFGEAFAIRMIFVIEAKGG
jgi:hypothetical protein